MGSNVIFSGELSFSHYSWRHYMKKILFFAFTICPIFSQARYVEVQIPSELAAQYMDKALEIFQAHPKDDVKLTEVNGIQYLSFKDMGPRYSAEQICARRISDNKTVCILRDCKELGGGFDDKSASLNRFSGVLWSLLPVTASYDWWGTKVYKNVHCFRSSWDTGDCTIENGTVKE